jgi:hypothetical protein
LFCIDIHISISISSGGQFLMKRYETLDGNGLFFGSEVEIIVPGQFLIDPIRIGAPAPLRCWRGPAPTSRNLGDCQPFA